MSTAAIKSVIDQTKKENINAGNAFKTLLVADGTWLVTSLSCQKQTSEIPVKCVFNPWVHPIRYHQDHSSNATSPVCVCSCGAALVAGMPLCAVPVHSGRWGPRRRDRVPKTERGRPAPNGRHEPLLERDQAQVPQHPVRSHSHWALMWGKILRLTRGCFWKLLR